jgi:hypothetical protein
MIIATENALMVCSSVKTQVDAGRATRPEGASACQFQWVTTTVMKQLVALHPLTYLCKGIRSKSSITGKNLRIRPGRFSLSCRDEPGPLVLPHPCARAVTEQGHTDIREYCGWACSPVSGCRSQRARVRRGLEPPSCTCLSEAAPKKGV